MSAQKTDETKTETPVLPFEDEKGMFGTSPIAKELTDEEVEYLTSRTAPRVILRRSRRKPFLYSSLSLIILLIVRLVYHRTVPVTGLVVPPVFGLGETGLTALCAVLAGVNFFLIPPQERNVRVDPFLRHRRAADPAGPALPAAGGDPHRALRFLF